MMDAIDRFLAKVEWTPTCWLWTGGVTGEGYGQFWVDGKKVLVHRFAYALAYGPALPGIDVLHTCDVRRCILYDHLFLGTDTDNARDAVRKGRQAEVRKTHCPAGHAYDAANTRVTARGWRYCRACHREWDRQRRAARKEG